MSLDLASLPAWAFAFVLVLGRIGAALTLLPGLGEASPQRIVEEHFMPVPVPDNASWTAEWLEYEAEAENWYSQQPTP